MPGFLPRRRPGFFSAQEGRGGKKSNRHEPKKVRKPPRPKKKWKIRITSTQLVALWPNMPKTKVRYFTLEDERIIAMIKDPIDNQARCLRTGASGLTRIPKKQSENILNELKKSNPEMPFWEDL
ncbi:MAG: hypothetical protein NUV67_00200 [archaeon]|nr:hypothetical protein [archaeon]